MRWIFIYGDLVNRLIDIYLEIITNTWMLCKDDTVRIILIEREQFLLQSPLPKNLMKEYNVVIQ